MKINNRLFLILSLLLTVNANASIKLKSIEQIKVVSSYSSLFQLYADNRAKNIGNYITPDLAVISFNLLKNDLLKRQELAFYNPTLQTFLTKLQQQQKNKNNSAKLTPVQIANGDFLDILARLIDLNSKIPLSARAQQEYQLINKAKDISNSPLWGYKIDYSQMKVRGHYSDNPALSAYFKTIKYANTVLFPFVASKATQITQKQQQQFISQAANLSQLITNNKTLSELYQKLNQRLTWSVGRAEDFTPISLNTALKKCPKQQAPCLIGYAQKNQLVPKIISQPIELSGLKPKQKATDVLIGFRLLPSRYSVDAELQQNMVYQKPNMLGYLGKKPPFSMSVINGEAVKGYPLLDELMVLAGSERAKEIMIPDTEYKDYQKYQQQNQILFKSTLKKKDSSAAEWTFTQEVLMANKKSDSMLTLMQVHQTWRRYQQQLYAKQSYTPSYKSIQPLDIRKNAAIQPAPVLYKALAKLIKVYQKQQPNEQKWRWLLTEVNKLAVISKKSENKKLISKEEIYYLNTLDRTLKAIIGVKDQPIVVDVHTNAADKQVLEEATGYIALVNKEKLRGGTITQYEFKQPLTERLTDKAWRKKLIGAQ